MTTSKNIAQNAEQHFPQIPRRLTIQSLSALILLLSGIALCFCAIYLPPVGVIDTSVIIVFGQILIAMGSLVGVDLAFILKIYLAFLNKQPLSNEKIPNKASISTSETSSTHQELE